MRVMTEVIDSRAFSDFFGINSPEQVPNGDTIGRFRNMLVENNLQEKMLGTILAILKEQNLILKKGTIVDSTFIEAPSSTKNKEKSVIVTRILRKKATCGISVTRRISE